jgi:hypothetical protein
MLRNLLIMYLAAVGMTPFATAQAQLVPSAPATNPANAPASAAASKTYTVPSGTRVLLSLKSEVSSRVAMPGDPVYLVSAFPVVEDGAIVFPAGMYVKGYIDHVQRPGKIKGRAQLQMHFATVIFPNGVEIALPGSLDNVPGSSGAKVDKAEGTVEQGATKGHDTQRIVNDSVEGAGLGGLVGLGSGSGGMQAGIGAGAGATVGILTTLFTRGNDIVFTPGTTLEMVLNRPVVVRQSQLAGMSAYTGVPNPTDNTLTMAPRN